MESQALSGGFSDPAIESALAFRAVMEAMARPGEIQSVAGAQPPAPLSPSAGAVLLTLCDTDTGVYLAGKLDCAPVRDWIAFHTGAPLRSAQMCQFAFGMWDALQPLTDFNIGRTDYPDRSATLVVELPELTAAGASLRGPGIRETAALSLPAITPFQSNNTLFPLGLDFIFTCGDCLAALPRTTEVS